MRTLLLAATLLLTVAPASAQTHDTPGGWSPSVITFSAGTSDIGPTVRAVRGGEWHVGGPLSIGIGQRSALSVDFGAEADDTPAFRPGGTVAYAEVGPIVRASLRAGQVEVAASAGIAFAAAAVDLTPFDSGITAPLEVEATVALGRGLGLTASASESLAITSVWSNVDRFAEEGYALENRAVTLGLRFGM